MVCMSLEDIALVFLLVFVVLDGKTNTFFSCSWEDLDFKKVLIFGLFPLQLGAKIMVVDINFCQSILAKAFWMRFTTDLVGFFY